MQFNEPYGIVFDGSQVVAGALLLWFIGFDGFMAFFGDVSAIIFFTQVSLSSFLFCCFCLFLNNKNRSRISSSARDRQGGQNVLEA